MFNNSRCSTQKDLSFDLVTLQDLEKASISLPARAVIMAGGMGTRLLRLTENTPKPMLPGRGSPHCWSTSLASYGKQASSTSTWQRTIFSSRSPITSNKVGSTMCCINYRNEPVPLGTAGSLRLLDRPQETLLVVTGDILTTLDYRAMLAYHKKHQADLSIAVRLYDVEVPYGVVTLEEAKVIGLVERRTYSFAVNAGIIAWSPSCVNSSQPAVALI